MSTQELKAEALSLPIRERVLLAQELWQSIHAGLSDTDEKDALEEAARRSKEMSSGKVVGRTHDEVMKSARRALGCS